MTPEEIAREIVETSLCSASPCTYAGGCGCGCAKAIAAAIRQARAETWEAAEREAADHDCTDVEDDPIAEAQIIGYRHARDQIVAAMRHRAAAIRAKAAEERG